jgi:hypothetical protein
VATEIVDLACTMKRAEEISGYTRSRLYQAVKQGRLRTWMVGKRRMTKPAYIQQMIDADERDSLGEAA